MNPHIYEYSDDGDFFHELALILEISIYHYILQNYPRNFDGDLGSIPVTLVRKTDNDLFWTTSFKRALLKGPIDDKSLIACIRKDFINDEVFEDTNGGHYIIYPDSLSVKINEGDALSLDNIMVDIRLQYEHRQEKYIMRYMDSKCKNLLTQFQTHSSKLSNLKYNDALLTTDIIDILSDLDFCIHFGNQFLSNCSQGNVFKEEKYELGILNDLRNNYSKLLLFRVESGNTSNATYEQKKTSS